MYTGYTVEALARNLAARKRFGFAHLRGETHWHGLCVVMLSATEFRLAGALDPWRLPSLVTEYADEADYLS